MERDIYLLPEYRIGPYRMRAFPGERSTFNDKRSRASNDWTGGVVTIDETLTPAGALTWFVRHLVGAIHYRSGLNDSCDEEAYTHSLATGMVELAHNNPEWWPEFNGLLAHHLCPRARWESAARGIGKAPSPPQRIVMDEWVCKIVAIPAERCEKQSAYAYYHPGVPRLEISDGLHGHNLVLVVMHEALHFILDCVGLVDGMRENLFKRHQALALIRFWKQNPGFWTWWLWQARQCAT